MNPWVRRMLMAVVVLFWLALMALPLLAFTLARSGQVQLGESQGRHWRLFLLQEPETEGLGLERGRPVAPPLDAPAASCLQTTVTYWLWVGEGQDATYCYCVIETTGESVSGVPPACISP